jgi:hypothetical protein
VIVRGAMIWFLYAAVSCGSEVPLGYVKGGGDYRGRMMLIYSNVAVRSARRGWLERQTQCQYRLYMMIRRLSET